MPSYFAFGMVILLNLFKHLLQYTVIAPEFQGFCLSETPKIIKMWAIFWNYA